MVGETKRYGSGKKKVIQATKENLRKLPKFITPMLAKETDKPFDDKHWLFEIKWDGYRAISEIKQGEVELYSRNGNSFNTSYPIVFNALKKLKDLEQTEGIKLYYEKCSGK